MIFTSHFLLRRFSLLRPAVAVAMILFVAEREARALVPFLDGGVFINVGAAAAYNTNIFANAEEEGDFYLTLMPDLQYIREAGLLRLEARAGIEVIRFLDFGDQDTEDLFTSLSLSYPNYPGKEPREFLLDVGWREKSGSNDFLGTRVHSEILDGSLRGRREISDRLGLRAGAGYINEQFSGGNFSEIDTWSLSADAIHIYSEHLETFIGYRYRHTETAGVKRRSLEIDDHLVQAGLEGQLTARIAGLVSAGVQQRLFGEDDLDDDLRPYGSVAVTWAPRARSLLSLEGIKDFSVTPDDRSVDSTSLRLVLKQGVYGGFSLEPEIAYTSLRLERPDDQGRDDTRYEAGIGFIYDLASGASAALRYSFMNQTSDDPFAEYTRHLIDLSAAIRF